MRHLFVAAFVVVVTFCVSVLPVDAGVLIGRPGQMPSGYLYLTAYEVHDRVLDMIESGDLDADQVTIAATGVVLSGTPQDLLIEAGVIHEFYVDRFDQVLRFDDPAWGRIVAGSWHTEWQAAYYWGTPS